MTTLFQSMIEFFENDNWKFMEISPGEVLKMGVSGENSDYECYAIADEETNMFQFISKYSVKIPENQRPKIAEFVTRANYGIRLGKFELDFRDGEVSFKSSVPCDENKGLSFMILKRIVQTNVFFIDEYFPGLMKVIYGGISPEQAIYEIENSDEN